MNSIGEWLGEHGLLKYSEIFAEHAIDFDILPDLTESDLKDFGVPFGDRKRIMNAVSSMRQGEAPARQPGPAAVRIAPAERRQLTVMFCDLVGSTALSEKLDPEEYRKVIVEYRTAVAQAISPFAGYIALYMGDGMLILFGYPQAHEDDAERALRAGLAVVDRVQQLPPRAGSKLQVRMGIATGLVVIGDIHGDGVSENNAVLGDTPNLAARLQGLAAPNCIVISADTRQLTADMFQYADLGRHQLKGIKAPAPAWRVIKAVNRESRFESVRGGSITPLIGRNQELDLLVERWNQSKERDGQVVLLVGEPGIGKSRIARSLQERVESERHFRLHYQCSPYFNHSALYPVISQLEWASGIDPQDSVETKLEKLQSYLLPAATPVEQTLALCASLMSIPGEDYLAKYDLPPEKIRERIMEVLIEQMQALEGKAPLLLIFEDVHWADPTSLELLSRMIHDLHKLRILLVITYRPDFSPPWTGYAHITTLTLNRLTRSQGSAIVEALTKASPLPGDVLQRMLETTDGVPLFIEEMTKAVLESFSQYDSGDKSSLAGSELPMSIPTTLRDSLMARLDRLGAAKEVIQIGAAIGREFTYKLHSAVTPLSQQKLFEALKVIVRSELVLQLGEPPNSSYVFKHSLMQEVAYTTMLQEKRRQLHGTIASVLEDKFPAIAETRPEILARHHSEAGDTDKAIGYFRRAGQLAASQSANLEAIAHFQRALKLLELLPADFDRNDTELGLLILLAGSLIASTGYTTPELGAVIERAQGLADQSSNPTPLFPILHGRYLMLSVGGQTNRAYEVAKKIRELAQLDVPPFVQMAGYRILGNSHYLLGRFASAHEQFDKALSMYDPTQHAPLAVKLGHDIRVSALAVQALAMWHLGEIDRALAAEVEAVDYASETRHVNSLGYALAHGAMLHGLARNYGMQQIRSEKLLALASENNLPVWKVSSGLLLGWALSGQGDIPRGLSTMQNSYAMLSSIGMRYWFPLILSLMAQLLARSGDPQAAVTLLDEAARTSADGGEIWCKAERIRITAEVRIAYGLSKGEQAAEELEQALQCAVNMGSKSFTLRAALDLARFRCEQNRFAEARTLLAPHFNSFAQGLQSPDLKEASALLEQLSKQ